MEPKNDVANFYKIEDYKESLERINKVIKYLPDSKPTVQTIPSLLNKSFDENFISDFLAYILNPNSNGIGIEPLRNLLSKIIKDDSDELDIEAMCVKEIKVYREYSLEDGGRIDILVEIGGDILLVIENKIYSGESEDQTKNYEKQLTRKYEKCSNKYFLFLTPHGTKPSSERFVPFSYKELAEALKDIKYDFTKDIKKSILFSDFITHIEEYIIGGNAMITMSEKTKLYIENYELMKNLATSFQADYEKITNHIKSMVKSMFGEIYEHSTGRLGKSGQEYLAIHKKGWYKRYNVFPHYEIWIGEKTLLFEHKLYVMFHVEGNNSAEFRKKYSERHKKTIDETYKKYGIVYIPKTLDKNEWTDGNIKFAMKYSIAFKEYCFSSSGSEIKQRDIDSVVSAIKNEFWFIAELVDDVMNLKEKIVEKNKGSF